MKEPNYKKLYTDIILKKYPEKILCCQYILSKKILSNMDVIELNAILSSDTSEQTVVFDQQHRAYSEETIRFILKYQIDNNLNNTQLSKHFKMSRNTIGKWKKDLADK